MTYKCEKCNAIYKSRSGLWKHSSIHDLNNKIQDLPLKIYYCAKCNCEFKHYQSRWKHEKTCNSNDVNILKEQFKQLKEEVTELKNKPNIINNYTTNNNTLNNKKIIIINSPGSESIAHLSIDQQRLVVNKGLQSLMYLIKTTNFDKYTPEYHSYCVTALNDKHASMIDVKTNSIIKTEKNELFDKILIGNIKKLEAMSANKNFGHNEREVYRLKLENLKELLFINKRGLKKYYNELNLLSYNNKDLIIETWASLRSLDDIINSDNSNNINLDVTSYDILNNNSQNILDYDSEDSDDSSDTQSTVSSDDNSENELVEIKIRGKKYILKNNKLYKIFNGSCGELYGIYKNGKVIKNYNICI